MNGWRIITYWYRKLFPEVSGKIIASFQYDTGVKNLRMMRWISWVFFPLVSLSLLYILLKADSSEKIFGVWLITSLIAFIALAAVLVLSYRVERFQYHWSIWAIRMPVIIVFMALLIWGAGAGWMVHEDHLSIFILLVLLFISLSLFSLTAVESFMLVFLGIGCISLPLFKVVDNSGPELLTTAMAGGFMLLFLLVSRFLYWSRMTSYINWENISTMNEALKNEIYEKIQAVQKLELIKDDLDAQVEQKTRHLVEMNRKLKEEITQKNYVDKVRNTLYRISAYLNQEHQLDKILSFVFDQIKSFMHLPNLLVGYYHEADYTIEPLFQVNKSEQFETFKLGRTLSSMVVRTGKSVLVNRREIQDLVKKHEVEIVGVPAESWLGVPLKVNSRVIGILMVQSYDDKIHYEETDQNLLEYVSEHLAFAIFRDEAKRKLVKAKEKAEESDHLKTAFLSNLSHEVRTPMNAIIGFSELMVEENLDSKERKMYASYLLQNGYRLMDTLTHMVEMAKIQAAPNKLSLLPLKTTALLNPVGNRVRELLVKLGKKEIPVKVQCEAKLTDTQVWTDQKSFNQLFLSLYENAVKFTQNGQIIVGARPGDNSTVVFYVKDTGTGIAPDELNRIFELFQKGDHSDVKYHPGTGLGLSIARILAERMNGRLWVESTQGVGSTFYFSLPVAKPISHPIQSRNTDTEAQQVERRKNASAG